MDMIFERADFERVDKGEASADELLVQKAKELMASANIADFRVAFQRIASVNREMHARYLANDRGAR